MSRRLPFTPQNFPSVFTESSIEQLQHNVPVEYADIIPKRYYLHITETGNRAFVDLSYICKNKPRIREIVYKTIYDRDHLGTWRDVLDEMGVYTTLRRGYDQLAVANHQFYDLATGFSDAEQYVHLDPEGVELQECQRTAGPIERRIRGIPIDFIGGRRKTYRTRKLRRKCITKKLRSKSKRN